MRYSDEVHPPYAGDYQGAPRISYAPRDDGDADPGEVVWTWVPFEENDGRGKDRPVLVIGLEVLNGAAYLLALMLTSKDHHRDAADEARHGRVWFDVGPGLWDSKRRASEVRLDRILQLRADQVRREGSRLDRGRFDAVVSALRAHHAWDR